MAISKDGKILVTDYGTELRRWDLNTWIELAPGALGCQNCLHDSLTLDDWLNQ